MTGAARAQNIAANRRYRERNRERTRAAGRARDRRRRHGPRVYDWIAQKLGEQSGFCYLCGDGLGQSPVIDHDHSCCPEGASCAACRRGLACDRCNRLIGQVNDSPALLRQIADRLEQVLEPTRQRIRAKDEQLSLVDMEAGTDGYR